MVNKNIQMKKREGNDWDNLFPVTLSTNVFNHSGETIEQELTNYKNNLEHELSEFEDTLENELNAQTSQLSQFRSEIGGNLSSLESSVDQKLTELNPRIESLEKYEQKITLENGVWSWWNYPLVQFKDNKTFFGQINQTGLMTINSFNHANSQVSTFRLLESEVNDHSAPTISFLQDGRPIVFYTRHNRDNYVRYRIGSKAYDIQSLGSEKLLGLSGRITYAQSFVDNDNKIHLFSRVEATKWVYLQSSDNGETFGIVKTLIDFGTNQAYMKIKPHREGKLIRMMFTGHPQSDIQDIYYCYLETVNGKITIPGGVEIANLYNDSSTVLNVNDLYKAYSPPTNQKTRLFDVSDGELTFLFAEFTNSTNGIYKYGSWNGTKFDIFTLATTGKVIGAGNSGYFGGGIIPENTSNQYVIARENNGKWTVERHSAYQGNSEIEILDESTTDKLFRPVVPVGNQENLLWVKGQYSEDNFTDFDTDIMFHNKILSNINFSMREIKQDIVLPDNSNMETLTVSLDRIPNPDQTFPLKFSYGVKPNIIINSNSTVLDDIRDSNKVVGAINSSGQLRLVGENSNVNWNATGGLPLIVRIIGT